MSSDEALLNELKGSIFEYLVARELARASGVEEDFLVSLGDDYQRLLERQDLMLRECFPHMPQFLFQWAKKTATHFLSIQPQTITQIRLAGQFSHQKDQGESDFKLWVDGAEMPVSLKLNKKQGLVNTKSAGVKSFLTQYFPHALELQERFSQLVEVEHALLRDELLELMGLPPAQSWTGWRERGLSELPGEQTVAVKEILHRYYSRLASQLERDLIQLQQLDAASFNDGLVRLLGFSHPQLIQLICFHELQSKNPQHCEVLVHDQERVRAELSSLRFRESRETASVELELKSWLLQIRIKPMNKFTTTAIKVNCSVKY
jgi:hypothetical protein